jgi:hypothetical protein
MRPSQARLRRWQVLVVTLALVPCAVAAQSDDADPEPGSPRASPPDEKTRLPISLDGGASINPDVLQHVKDDTLGLTDDDREVYFRVLKLVRQLEPAELRTLAREFREDRHAASPRYRHRPIEKFPTFVDLFQHPAEYRGRPVSLHGRLRRLISYPAGKTGQGFDQLYEGWFFADDAQGNPAVVIFTEKPEELPISGDIEEEVSVTGYFLKMYGYPARDTTRRAPLILARTVTWHPQPETKRWNPSPETYLSLTLGIVIFGLVVALMVRESQLRAAAEKQARRARYADFEPIDDASAARPSEPGRNGSPAEPHH